MNSIYFLNLLIINSCVPFTLWYIDEVGIFVSADNSLNDFDVLNTF